MTEEPNPDESVLDDQRLLRAVKMALEDPEISEGVQRSGARPEYFEKKLLAGRSEIDRHLGKEIEKLVFGGASKEGAGAVDGGPGRRRPWEHVMRCHDRLGHRGTP